MRRLFQGLILLSLILWPMEIHAQSEELTEAIKQAGELLQSERFREAIPYVEKVISLGEQEYGSNDPGLVEMLDTLGHLYRIDGQYDRAEPLYTRVLAIREKALGPKHLDVATSLNDLALVYWKQGRYAEAEPLYRRALAIREKALGPNHRLVAASLNNLALLHDYQGRYAEAELLYKRSISVTEKILGPDHPEVATSLDNLAGLYTVQARYAEAESVQKRVLEIREESLGPDHPDLGTSLGNLAQLYYLQGRYAEAEPLYKRSTVILEQALGPEHPDVATSLNNLAAFYQHQSRYNEAETLHTRALAIRMRVFGPDHPAVAGSLNNLAEVYQDQSRFWDAEPLYKRALIILQQALGLEHPDVAATFNNLAALYQNLGRSKEAEVFYKFALASREKSLGSDHPDVAMNLNNLAELYRLAGRYTEAEPIYKRALAMREKALGPQHPDVATTLNNLALLYGSQGRFTAAIGLIRRASAIYSHRAIRSSGNQISVDLSEQRKVRWVFINHADIALRLLEQQPSQSRALASEAFKAMQLAQVTSAAGAVSRMGARFGSGEDALADIVRAQQDAAEQWRRLDKVLLAALSQTPDKRDLSIERRIRADLVALDHEIAALDEQLSHEFPDYSELANPRPLPLADAQSLLAPDEALISYAVASDRTLLSVVSKDSVKTHRLDIDGEDLKKRVQSLRATLTTYTNLQSFNVKLAHDLYEQIFAPTEELLEGVSHIFIVPDGPLQSLPFGVLIKGEVGETVPWLARRYAITTLPSVSSLRTLRQYARASNANEPFLGIGDPVLSGHPSTAPRIEISGLFSLRGIGEVDAVRSLPSLPETAEELEALAENLKASTDSLLLRKKATERNLRSIDLDRYRILAFATHAVVAGELKGLAEPALVLTPPEVGTDEDDGLLTASEVVTLKLDADWVILSACNTAAPDGTPGAEALSGLAKVFFYAGSRALLVSHWPVSSEAAVALTTRMLAEYSNDPKIGRAEALRRSMLALMDDPRFAHPFYWAPFVIVGEGGQVADWHE